MRSLFLLTVAHKARLEPDVSKLHGKLRVDHRRVLCGLIFFKLRVPCRIESRQTTPLEDRRYTDLWCGVSIDHAEFAASSELKHWLEGSHGQNKELGARILKEGCRTGLRNLAGLYGCSHRLYGQAGDEHRFPELYFERSCDWLSVFKPLSDMNHRNEGEDCRAKLEQHR